MSGSPEDEPKIIVDSDWKAQVQAEKEKMKAQEQTKQSAPETSAHDVDDSYEQEMPQGEIPPASFVMLVTTLATQAASALGQIPDPMAGKTVVNKHLAKHLIDTLGILEEKTQGNLTSEEAELLQAALHELRFAFVSIKS